MSARILIVDDEKNLRRMLQALLEEESYAVRAAGDADEAIRAAAEFEPHVVLLDLVMDPGPNGLTVLGRLKREHPDPAVIMMSGKATLDDAVRAIKLGAFQFLEKPLTPEAVLVTVRAALDLVYARSENRLLREALGAEGDIVGTCAGIERVRTLIAQVAPTPSRVLITGESGTGKELVARAVHRASPRAARPLVSVNCASVPKELVESEMFGHEKGAFTGALQRRRGKFELADGGTLFLDEVGDLEPAAQAKLLRALESGTIQRVGAEREITVDVRVIAATNRDLESDVRNGRFRQDLFYRLNVFPIHVPPLRERTDDIPLLVQHFAAVSAERSARSPRAFTDDAIDILCNHPWPGNVRELANVVERLTIVGGAGEVSAAEVAAVLGPRRLRQTGGGSSKIPSGGLAAALEEYEAALIREAIAQAGGNVAEAARMLQTDRPNLYRRMRRLGLDRDTDVSN